MTIDPKILDELLAQAKYTANPTPDLYRLVAAVVEHCASIADKHEPGDAREVGADIRAQFGLH